MRLETFRDAREALATFVPLASDMHKNYTLERMSKLMDKLGNPQNSYKVIHVAGTSGKTSTCYYLASLLKETGTKVGLTVSPHITEVNERVQINLQPLPEAEFCSELSEFLDIIEQTGIKPTYFELLIAFAFWEFARQQVDYAVVEVGLGGLLDCTNVITREDKICIITDIGLDHTSVLGNTLTEIATQKAGIIQPNNTVLTYRADEEVRDTIRQAAARQQAQLKELSLPPDEKLPANLPLFQKRNWYLAYEVYIYLIGRDRLPVMSQKQLMPTATVPIPARMETIQFGNKIIVLDGAHNPQKMQALTESLKTTYQGQPIACLFGLIKSGDYRVRGTLGQLASLCSHIILTSFKTEQDLKRTSVSLGRLVKEAQTLGIQSIEPVENPKQAFEMLMHRPEAILLMTGSFFLIQEIRPLVLQAAKNIPAS